MLNNNPEMTNEISVLWSLVVLFLQGCVVENTVVQKLHHGVPGNWV